MSISYSTPFRSDQIGRSEPLPGCSFNSSFFLFFFFFKVWPPESPARLKWQIQTETQFTPTVFIYLIKNILFMSFYFRVFNYAEAFQMVGHKHLLLYNTFTNDVSCLYKMIYKTIVQRLTLLFTKCHTFKKNGMHMTEYILICRNFLYDSALLDLAFFPVYSKPAHR